MGDATDIVRNGIPGVPRPAALGIEMRGDRMVTIEAATGRPIVVRDAARDPGLLVMLDEAKRRQTVAEQALYRHAQLAGRDGNCLA